MSTIPQDDHAAPRFHVTRLDATEHWALTLLTGAHVHDVTTACTALPADATLLHTRTDHSATTLTFRAEPGAGHTARPAPHDPPPTLTAEAPLPATGGWTPDVSPAAVGADPGYTPYQLALADLLQAAPNPTAAALLLSTLLHAPHPAAALILDDLLWDARCTRTTPTPPHDHDCPCCANTHAPAA